MNNPTPWINTVLSEPCPLPGGYFYSSTCLPCSTSTPSQDTFWRTQFFPQTQETSVYVLVAKAYMKSSKDQSLRARITEIGALEADWDGDGAPAIDPMILQSTLRILDALPPNIQTEASPNTNGTISLYLTVGNRYAELEIGRTRYGWAAFREGNPQASAAQSGNVEEMADGRGIHALLAELQENAIPLRTTLATPLHSIRERVMAGGEVRFNASRLWTLEPAS